MRRRRGFSLAELLIVMTLGAVIVTAFLKIGMMQQRSLRTQSLMGANRDALRTTLAILTSELREVSAAAAGPDLSAIGADSIVFRATRQVGFVCALHAGDNKIDVWTLGTRFDPGDSVMVFAEGDTTTRGDDYWALVAAADTVAPADGSCAGAWADAVVQGLKITGLTYADVQPGAPLRGFEWLVYGLYQDPEDGSWYVGRHAPGEAPAPVVDRVAAPDGSEPLFRYYDDSGAETTDPQAVTRIAITLRGPPYPQGEAQTDVLTTQLYLRND